ncbi:hypothetical protein [Haloferax prahovense]|uniref:hypothetical protein n=1 Tax=Haloferax prahovense TaxID=381852 RepID=UPI001375A29F|nr:hypothetical protein [Haloferax prahovense]
MCGLFIDIFGALLIAFPDVPDLANKREMGALRSARDKMNNGSLDPRDSGFDEVKAILENSTPVETANEKPNPDYVKITKTSRSGLAAKESHESDVNLGDEYIEGHYQPAGHFAYSDFFRVSPVYEKIRERIENDETKVRSGGFMLLSIGFILQIFGTAM